MEAWWFSRIVAHHPCVILLTVFLFSCTCLIAPRTIQSLPDFSDPQLGFEARGTILAQRLTAWQNLMEATKPRGEFTDNPFEFNYYLEQVKRQTDSISQNHSWASQGILRKKPKSMSRKKGKKYMATTNETEKDTSNDNNKDEWKELSELRNKNQFNIIEYDKIHNNLDSENFFCNLPSPDYARVVIGSTETEEKSLWTMEGVLAQCHIDAALRANPHFTSLCQVQEEHNGIKSNNKCCRSWSPANYVALLSNRSSCLGVTESDLIRVEALLRRCAYYYYNLELTFKCAEDPNCQKRVRAECYQHNAVYHLLHYLLDFNFIPNDKHQFLNKSHLGLQSAMLFLPMAASSASLDFYKELNNNGLSYGKFKVQGMQLGLKSTLFDRLLVSNFSLVLTGFGFVTLCIWMYTGSLLLTIATFFAVLFSLGISYAVYTLVLQIKFFPFMNLLAIVVAVGIGADDAFIYCKVWECCKQQKLSNDGLPRLVQETMKHAIPSMFVTSLTTAVAFFASIVSNVTAINCFSLFSGMTVIANFFLMITWLPACVVVSERCRITTLSPASFITRKIIRPVRLFADKIALTFSTFLTKIAIGLRWFWLVSLGALATACCIVVFYNPGLQLPDTPDFQLFESSHPFEQYDLIYSRQFLFEKREMIDDGEALPMRFVWGIKPIDNGDYLNPDKKGKLELDDSFDVSHPKSQLWLQQFCYNLRLQPFYRSTLGALLHNCFIESLKKWMERHCEDPINKYINYSPCCKKSTFPYKPKVLRKCAAEAAAHLYDTPSYLWHRGGPVSAGLKFLKKPVQTPSQGTNATESLKLSVPKIKALVIEYNSIYNYSLSYSDMDQFYNQVETWMQKQLKTAPPTMQGGWFVSELEFYELQRTLHEGTIWAMIVSLILALAVLAFVTLNPLVSMYAIITIGAAIIVTVAALILLGWKLNVLESVAVSTAIGLAVDFSLHYAVSYRACNSEQRMDKVKATLNQMGGPTLMAALTSGIAGALMLPSDVLAYIQIGVFLLLVMGISWIYATLFLCPMLAVIGPSSHFAQFQYPRADHNSGGGLGTSRWLEAIWEPSAKIYTLPGGVDMLDVIGDGDARLISTDLGSINANSAKIRVYKGSDQVTEHNMMDAPCGIAGFYTENGEPRSAVLAAGASSSVYIFKNLRPFFKYCLPHLEAHPKEREIWHKAGLDEELNVLTLADDLDLLLKELGATAISPRTLKFLTMDVNLRMSFAEQYRRVPLIKNNTVTALGVIRKDSWNDPACSCLIIGTENKEIFVLDPRAFTVMDKHLLKWPPVSFATTGLWAGDGRIMVIGRDGNIGAIRRGSPVKLWEKLEAPIIAVSVLSGDGAAVAIMDGTLLGFSKKGVKVWSINVPGIILDMVSLPVPQSGLSLLAVSTVGYGVRIYDGKHHVDTIKTMEPVSAIKYGRMGQEERTMAMVTISGGLCVKILKRTADFSIHNTMFSVTSNSVTKFVIPKKTRLFVEQTIRERSEAKKIHNTFQQGFLRLRLIIAKNAVDLLTGCENTGLDPISLEANVLGLGPNYQIQILITNISDGLSDTGLFIVCRGENTEVDPRVVNLPLLLSGIPIPITVDAKLTNRISGKVQVLLCKKDKPKPLAFTNVILPAAEEEIEV